MVRNLNEFPRAELAALVNCPGLCEARQLIPLNLYRTFIDLEVCRPDCVVLALSALFTLRITGPSPRIFELV